VTQDRGKILVTGGRGFLGRALASELTLNGGGREVVVVDLFPPGPNDMDGPSLDLCQADTWRALGNDFQWVFHLAAAIPPLGTKPADINSFRANLAMAENLLSWALEAKPRVIVLASSISVYPMGAAPVLHEKLACRPDSSYAAAKLAAENLTALLSSVGTKVAALRLSSLYGPGQQIRTVLSLFVKRALEGHEISVHGQGLRTQDFVHVDDAARGFCLAAKAEAQGVYNLASGRAVNMAELAGMAANTALALKGITTSVKLKPSLEEGPSVQVDVGLARDHFGFQANMDLERGIVEYAQSILGRSC